MDSISFELCSDTQDPLDRTLCVRAMSGTTLVAARSIRLAPEYPIGTVLLYIDRIALAWAQPQLTGDQHLHDVLDVCEVSIGVPF